MKKNLVRVVYVIVMVLVILLGFINHYAHFVYHSGMGWILHLRNMPFEMAIWLIELTHRF